MNHNVRITSNFIQIKIFAALLVLAVPCIAYIQDGKPFLEGLIICVPFWILAGLLVFFVKTRNVVYFDGKAFYIHDWKGQLKLTVPAEKITSIYSLPIKGNPVETYVVRYYDAPDKGNTFYIFPRWTINIFSIIKQIKEVAPGFID